MSTIIHDVQLAAGRLRLTITETPAKVFVSISGVRPRGCELPKLRRALLPIIFEFNSDPRPLEIAGTHADYTAAVFGTGDACLAIVEPLPGAEGAQ